MNSNGKKILVVEDDQFLREFYSELLVGEGYIVEVAEDGEVASGKIHQGGFDLVLLDIMLPKKDGIQLLKEHQTTPSEHPIRCIVMLTNLGQEEIIKQCLDAGANGYLVKSALNPEQVLVEIDNYLKL